MHLTGVVEYMTRAVALDSLRTGLNQYEVLASHQKPDIVLLYSSLTQVCRNLIASPLHTKIADPAVKRRPTAKISGST